jgi:hypothetical protein
MIMMDIIHVSRAHLTQVDSALQTLSHFAAFRGYARTIRSVLDDWRNQANDVQIRLRKEVLVDLGTYADTFGPIWQGLCDEWDTREQSRKRLIEYGAWAKTLPSVRAGSPEDVPC